jgi:hypothetical protein
MREVESFVAKALVFASILVCSGCPSSDDSPAKSADAGADVDAASPDDAHDAGRTPDAKDSGTPDAKDSGTTEDKDSGVPVGMMTDSLCPFTVSGGVTLPAAGSSYLCQVGTRILQNGGSGEYTLLMTAAAYIDGNPDSTTIACTLDSPTPPKAGDVWMIDAEHSGNCDLSSSKSSVATLWHAASTPKLGSLKVTFKSATKMMGVQDPTDVYYLFDITYEATVEPVTDGAAVGVTVKGSYKTIALPLGG